MKPGKRVLDFRVKFPQLEVNPGEFRGGRKLYGVSKNFQTGDVIGDPNETRKRYIEIMSKSPPESQTNGAALDSYNPRESRSKSFVKKELRRDASEMNQWNTSTEAKQDRATLKRRSITPNQLTCEPMSHQNHAYLDSQSNEIRYADYTPPKISKESFTISKQPVISLSQKPISFKEKYNDLSGGISQSPKAYLERQFENSPKVGAKLSETLGYNMQSQLDRNYAISPELGKKYPDSLSQSIVAPLERNFSNSPELGKKLNESQAVNPHQILERSIELDKKYAIKHSPSYIITSVQDSSPAHYRAPTNSSSNIFNANLLKQRVYTKKNPLVNSSNPITWFQEPSIDRDRKLKDYGSFMLK